MPTTRRIHGPSTLHGAEASIGDLRAGASLILAALAAEGASLIHGAHHVHRGYENIDRKFQQLGAIISRSADRPPDLPCARDPSRPAGRPERVAPDHRSSIPPS